MKQNILIIAFFAIGLFSCKKQLETQPEKGNQKAGTSTKSPYPSRAAEVFATTKKASTKKDLNQVVWMGIEFGDYNEVTGTTHVQLKNGAVLGAIEGWYRLKTNDGHIIQELGWHGADYSFDIVLPVGTYVFDYWEYPSPYFYSKPFTVSARPPTPPSGLLNLLRYYNPTTNRHFYSTNWGEIGSNGHNYLLEKVQGFLYADAGPGRLPLYEYYNQVTDDHWYTTNSNGWAGYQFYAIIGYVSSSQTSTATLPLNEYYGSNTGHVYTSPPENMSGYTFNTLVGYIIPYSLPPVPQPIHQFYNISGTDHFISPDPNAIAGYYGWTYSGVEFKAYLNQEPGTVPVYEFYNAQYTDHYDSTNQNAVNGYPGWVSYGVKFYAYTSQVSGTIPIYLFIHNGNHDHYLSANPNAATAAAGWGNAGVAFYAFPQ